MVTEEELQNMSPEEIAELQKQQCIFCHIISGKVASKKVYEDDTCLAILDINPANPGHILVLPKEHYQIMPQVPEETIAHLFMVVKHLSQAALKALKVEGVNILIANGVAAGQKAPHFMIHIIPRTKDDGLKFIVPQKKVSDSDMKVLHDNVKKRINAVFGIEEEAPVVLDKKPEQISEPEVLDVEFNEEKEEVEDIEVSEEEDSSDDAQISEGKKIPSDDVQKQDISVSDKAELSDKQEQQEKEVPETEGIAEQVESGLNELDTLLGGEHEKDESDDEDDEDGDDDEVLEEESTSSDEIKGEIDLDEIAGLF